MDNKTLKQIISQIKKYGLVDVFKTTDIFENWISSLNTKQIDNFLNLNIEPKEVANFKSILINNDLLNCQDYSKKVGSTSIKSLINIAEIVVSEAIKKAMGI